VVGVKRISFNSRFVNEAGDDLIAGEIHTIRRNYDFWKRFEGRDVALFTWEGTPYRSKQRVFCIKKIVSVQKITLWHDRTFNDHKMPPEFFIKMGSHWSFPLSIALLAAHDGFDNEEEFIDWFYNHPDGKMAILHFTEFKYRGVVCEKTGQ
jgi:hypothetical protein